MADLPALVSSRIRTARQTTRFLTEDLADLDFGGGDLEGCLIRAENVVTDLRQALEWQEQLKGEE